MKLLNGIISGDRHRSQEDIQRNALQAASGLVDMDIQPGDAIALLLRNDFVFFEATFAAQAAGIYAVLINWHLTELEIGHILRDSEARVLVVHTDLLIKVKGQIPGSLRILVVPTPPEIINAYGLSSIYQGANYQEWEAWLQEFEPLQELQAGVTETMMYTSGTTGLPKGVRRVVQTNDAARRLAFMRDEIYGVKPGVRALMTGPLYHAAPNSFGLRAAKIADALVLMPKFDSEIWMKLIEEQQITTTFMVPTMFARLLKLPEERRNAFDLSSLDYIMHAAAPCPSDIKRRMIGWLGPIVNEFYGGTEGGYWTVCSSQDWLENPGTVGRPAAGVTLKVLTAAGEEVPVGQAGVLYGKLDCFPDFTYHKRRADRDEIGHGNLITIGDIGYINKDGFVFICDRVKDMVVSGGANIYPAEIEAELSNMAEINDCAVFGIPDDEFGEQLIAVVQLQPEYEISETGIIAYLRSRLAGFKVPRIIKFCHSLPRSDDGKIYKRRLRDPYWKGRERSV